MAQVVLENIYKTFPLRQGEQEQEANTTENASPDAPRSTSNTVLRRINLTVEDGEFMVLVGEWLRKKHFAASDLRLGNRDCWQYFGRDIGS